MTFPSPSGSFGRAAVLAVAAVLAIGPRNVQASGPPDQGCLESVCLELTLPPHVRSVRPTASLECNVVLRETGRSPVHVVILLRAQGTKRCHRHYEEIAPGVARKRITVPLAALGGAQQLPGGNYEVGAALVPGKKEIGATGPCTPWEEKAKFLKRRLNVTPQRADSLQGKSRR